ncbi:MAG: LysE family transporter [Bacteroidales bacterium]|nr:LysE family transporter [Bacteroidales bacterium]
MILSLIIKCFIIGVMTSIPMGPLGIVCIQRTINKGRQHGFVTGLGAATSDLIYASIIGFSMSYMLELIETYANIISLVSFSIIILFGVLTFLKKPKQFTPNKHTAKNYNNLFKDYISAFGLCISNPMISVFFIALFAQFEVFKAYQPFYISIFTLILIFCSASICWGTVSYFVDKFRDRFNERSIIILNKIAGTLLCLFGAWGIISTIIKHFQ